MPWPTELAARLQHAIQCVKQPTDRPGHRPARPSPQHQARADAELVQQSQTALGLFLGLSDSDALALACTVLAHRQTWRAGQRAAVPVAPPGAAGQRSADANSLARALGQGSCLLALPCCLPALRWLGGLVHAAPAPMVLVDSPALAPLLDGLDPFGRMPAGALRRCSATEVIQQVKAGRSGAAPATLYISFPELHAAGPGTSAQVRFLGQTLRWSLLEPLLCLQGLKTLLTLAPPASTLASTSAGTAPGAAAGQPLALVSRATVAAVGSGPHGQGDNPAAILAWLVGHLECAVRSQPGMALAWPQLYRASAPFQAITRSNRLKQLEAFFAAWQAAGGGLQQQTQAFVTTRLAVLRSTA